MSMYELLQKEGGWKHITHLVYLEPHPDPYSPSQNQLATLQPRARYV